MLPRDVTDNAALFPMFNQIDKEFKDLAFEEKEQLFFQSPEESDELKRDVTNLEEEVHRKLSDMQSRVEGNLKKQVNYLNQKLNATIVGCRSKSEMHEESLLKVSMLERSIMGLKQ